ncbi:uncharacterized protein LOC143253727 isoform X2 [Tachypleus tridentatus]
MAADCQQCRKYLKNQGLEAALVSLLMSPHTNVIESCIFALSSYTKWKDISIWNLVDLNLVKLISDIITWPDIKHRMLTDFSEIMLRLGSEEGPWELTPHWQLISQTLAKRLSEISDMDVALSILRCLTNMVVGDVSEEALFVPDYSCITKLLQSDFKCLRLECVRLLGNTIVKPNFPTFRLEELINNVMVPMLDSHEEAKLQALFLLNIIINQGRKIAQTLTCQRLLESLSSIQQSPSSSSEVLVLARMLTSNLL